MTAAVGMLVGVAVGVLFAQSSFSTGSSGDSVEATDVGSAPSGGTATSSTTATVSVEVDALQAHLAEVQGDLALAEERFFVLRLEVDPASYAAQSRYL